MDLTEIQKLISEFNASPPTREMEIETDGFHLRLSKNEITAELLQQFKGTAGNPPKVLAMRAAVLSANKRMRRLHSRKQRGGQQSSHQW